MTFTVFAESRIYLYKINKSYQENFYKFTNMNAPTCSTTEKYRNDRNIRLRSMVNFCGVFAIHLAIEIKRKLGF